MLTHLHMGIADRDYERQPPRGYGGFTHGLTPAVKWLMIANVGIFLIDYVLLPLALGLRIDDFRRPPLVTWGAFAVESAIHEFRIWEFITFQFLHDSVGHLLFNSLGLFFFGPWLERWWGSRKFLGFYLACGCGGAAFFTLLSYLGVLPGGMRSALVGASAGIYGIFIGVAVIAPGLRVALLFPPIELSMRQLAIAMLSISVVIIAVGFGNNEGGEAGHLGGAIAGFLLMRYPWLLGNPGDSPARGGSKRSTPPREPKLRPRTQLPFASNPEVDRILDKISREGIHSITPEEREILETESKRQSKNP